MAAFNGRPCISFVVSSLASRLRSLYTLYENRTCSIPTILYYTHLYAPIRPFRIVSSYVTRYEEIIMFDFKYSRALKNVHRIPE